ncbi:lysylphosphatidylglycerol synthase domain-containing protein [Chelatococcus reniformis]|uniref:Membrane protein n=1 Tax=Chelatococcus reniformis TaxID=1494448 RepID=A0A916XQV9_9HYPH|nr:lysylphosphatidylglycerol synthase domain-containing protein [Chelatococcus reniformis]GGC93564.1 membrane protein [Chelatococcus reniformis]
MRSEVKEPDASGAALVTVAADADAAQASGRAADDVVHHARRRRFSILGGFASAVLFAAALYVLWRTVSQLDAADVRAAFSGVTGRQTCIALLLTCTSYVLLTGYDFLALRQMRLRVPYRTTALASFTSYAVSFTLGFPLVTAGTVRYWIYSAKGLRASQVATLTVIAGITFWLGMGVVLAWSLVREAGAIALLAHTRIAMNQIAGLVVFAVVAGYLVWVSIKHRAATIQGWRLELPGFRLTIGQMILGAGDVCAGAGVLYVLLPAGHGLSYETFLAIYVCACMLGIASHAPGGLGVFEATILVALSGLPGERVLGALLLFRLYYYLMPFVVALLLLGAHEVRKRLRARAWAAPP